MAKNTEAFGGFNELVDMITKVDKDPKDKIQEIDTVDDVVDDDDLVAADVTDKTDVDEPVVIPPVVDEPVDDEPTDDDVTDLGEVEPEVSSYFATSLIEKLGIELDNKDAKFEKLDDVIGLMGEIIQANSKPSFANEEVEEYDKYVRNGGNLKAFYDEVYKDGIDVTQLDLEEEKDQKLAIETNLRNLGYKEDKIKKTIDRYSDAEVLRDEAVDAIEEIKEFQSKKSKTLLANQEKERVEADKRNKDFVDNVVKYVDNLKDIRGVAVDSKTKKEIVDYIFRVTPDGTTQFQKAYASDIVKNLIESAYFTKYGDTLLSTTTKKATDAALNKVRDKLKASKGKRNTGSGSGLGKASPNFSALSGLIIR